MRSVYFCIFQLDPMVLIGPPPAGSFYQNASTIFNPNKKVVPYTGVVAAPKEFRTLKTASNIQNKKPISQLKYKNKQIPKSASCGEIVVYAEEKTYWGSTVKQSDCFN